MHQGENFTAARLPARKILVAAGALLSLGLGAAPAHADVKAGVEAWSAGDFARAVSEWQAPAAAGDADALFNLAQAYRLGRGVATDNARARALYEEAARLGHVKAADNFGLLLFQEGDYVRAMPLVRAAVERGDPRAQYVLGLAHFNADHAPRDWVRAYALMTLASGAGLPQAQSALAQMDRFIPEAQRIQAQALARELEAGAKAQRVAELAAADLAGRPAMPASRPAAALVAAVSEPPPPVAAPAAVPARTPAPVAAPGAAQRQGRWRVQLGAFGVAANADRLWRELGGHAALAGTRKILLPSGKLTRLLAGGFASEAEAARACAALQREGKACLVAGEG